MWTINSRWVEWRTHETRNNGEFGTCSIGHRTYQWSWSSSMILARPNFFAILIQPIIQVKYMLRISKHHYTRHLGVWGARLIFFGLTFAHCFFLRNHAKVHKYTFTHILTWTQCHHPMRSWHIWDPYPQAGVSLCCACTYAAAWSFWGNTSRSVKPAGVNSFEVIILTSGIYEVSIFCVRSHSSKVRPRRRILMHTA